MSCAWLGALSSSSLLLSANLRLRVRALAMCELVQRVGPVSSVVTCARSVVCIVGRCGLGGSRVVVGVPLVWGRLRLGVGVWGLE